MKEHYVLPCCKNSLSDLPEITKRDPHEIFTSDLFFFLCNGSKLLCHLQCTGTYEIHRQSPFTKEIRWLMETIHIKPDSYYKAMYDGYKNMYLSDPEEKMFADFCYGITNELNAVISNLKTATSQNESNLTNLSITAIVLRTGMNCRTDKSSRLHKTILSKLANVVKWSIVSQENGMKGALPTAFMKISETLHECNRMCNGCFFDNMSSDARSMLQLFIPDREEMNRLNLNIF